MHKKHQYTPGPWTVEHDTHDGYYDVGDGKGKQIAGVNDVGNPSANANLIAAAPDLLAALLSILAAPTAGDAADAIAKARPIIAKATGSDVIA